MSKMISIKLLAIAFAICLLSFVPTVVLAQGNGQGGPDDGGNGNGSDHGQQWKDESGSNGGSNGNGNNDEDAVQEGYRKQLFGHFNLTDGVADGKFITFAFDESSGDVSDYALKNRTGEVTFFDSIQILGFTPSNVSLHGAVMLIQNDSIQAIIHDNPTGMYHVVSNETNTSVSFLLAPGMNALPLSPEVSERNERDGDNGETEMMDGTNCSRSAVAVFGDGAYGVISTDDGNITIETSGQGTYVNVTVSYDHVMFRAKPVFSHHHMNEDAILTAISEGRVAGEISLVLRNGVTSYDTMEYRDEFRLQLLSTERDRIRIQVEDQDHKGKVVILNVDQQTLDSQKGELILELDGAPIKTTTNPLEVLYADGSDSSDAVYCVMESEGVSQFLVYVPSFSIHQLSISSLGPMDSLTSSMGIVAVVGALAIVAVAGFLVLRRRR
ncbi:MAG: hypothetical protein LUQ16_05435 [Methanomassiliicoccales archaeon]|jgi:hypothetical protein|nr:hypothetical protein [Methanomassiliicoccales archaeon]MDD1756989.1 hypothetical protein [Methanomassiliicoccales archaeon]